MTSAELYTNSTRRPVRARRVACLLAALALVVAACAPAEEEPFSSELPEAAAADDGGGAAVEAAAGCDPANPAASLSPTDPLPGPGELPAGSYMAEIRDRGVLRAGVGVDTLLFGYLNPQTGNIEGFDVEMARLVAQAIFGDPDRVELIPVQSAERIDRVQDGTVDLVVKTMTITCERWASINFSSVYYESGQRLLVGADSGVLGLDDLLAVQEEAKAQATAEELEEGDPPLPVCTVADTTSLDNLFAAGVGTIEVDQWTECLVAFQQGQAFGISTDDTILAGLAAQDPYATVVGDSFSEEPYGIGLPQDRPEFTAFVNAVLEEARNDGTWESLYDLWLAPVLGAERTVPRAS